MWIDESLTTKKIARQKETRNIREFVFFIWNMVSMAQELNKYKFKQKSCQVEMYEIENGQ